ncbi:MAG: hypothetical protein AAB518_01785 [Patescibacteria group bacterium]
MADKFTFSSAGLVHELELAMDRVGGWNAAIVKRMCEGDRLVHIREVLLGQAEIVYPPCIVDCDLNPTAPKGWTVKSHAKGGKVKLERRGDALFVDGVEIELFLDDTQKKDSIQGHKLREKLTGKPVLNACVLDYLLAHPHLIPESWKKDEQGRTRYIFFWGTIFRDSGDGLGVRCLCWDGGRWSWGYGWLGSGFGDQDLAAVCAAPIGRQASLLAAA